MFSRNNLRMRKADSTDLSFITNIRMSEHVQSNVGMVLFANESTQTEWLNKSSADGSKLYAIFEEFKVDRWVRLGYIRITDIDHQNKSMCVGGDLDIQHCGKGHGKSMYEMILALGFDTWNMNRIWLLVLETNTRAQNLYLKMGFKKEGVQRGAIFKSGRYVDYVMMSLLKDEHLTVKGSVA